MINTMGQAMEADLFKIGQILISVTSDETKTHKLEKPPSQSTGVFLLNTFFLR